VIKSLSKAQRTKMRMATPVSRGPASNPTKNKYLSFLEEQDIIQPQHATQIQQVLDVNDRDVKEVRQQVLVGTWLGSAALRALAAPGPGGAAMGGPPYSDPDIDLLWPWSSLTGCFTPRV
jgi:hypothetical protein